ncbi:hypothetical protein NSTCB13_04783 [Nostoc sp. DSM 114160]|jgi:hypothetical protein
MLTVSRKRNFLMFLMAGIFTLICNWGKGNEEQFRRVYYRCSRYAPQILMVSRANLYNRILLNYESISKSKIR